MVTLTGTVRPASIWKLKDFTDLYSMIHQLELQSEAHRLLVRSLTNVLLLPWPGTQDQRWDDRWGAIAVLIYYFMINCGIMHELKQMKFDLFIKFFV